MAVVEEHHVPQVDSKQVTFEQRYASSFGKQFRVSVQHSFHINMYNTKATNSTGVERQWRLESEGSSCMPIA